MSERSYAERDVALLVRCPKCGAVSGSACWNEWATAKVPTHPVQLEVAHREILRVADEVPDPEGPA
jgi:hypothetical protein